uniref:hypothetical protein n=1 Tax=Streptomyces sp. HPF1205 TaxID=2873262 RepID=UPI0035ABF2DD
MAMELNRRALVRASVAVAGTAAPSALLSACGGGGKAAKAVTFQSFGYAQKFCVTDGKPVLKYEIKDVSHGIKLVSAFQDA